MLIVPYKEKQPEVHLDAFVAPNATLIGAVKLSEKSSVWFSAVLRGDNAPIVIGEGSNIQDLSMLHVDEGFPVHVGRHCVVGHQALLHGCKVGDRCLVGMASQILNGAVLEDDVMLGAGSIVPPNKRLKSGWLYLGRPARAVRELTEKDREAIALGCEHYMEKARDFS